MIVLKYIDYMVTFQEFPDEISLCVNISGCPNRCPGCHSQWLNENNGTELDEFQIDELINSHDGITCFGIMGGDIDHTRVLEIALYIKNKYPELKVGMYSGNDKIDKALVMILDYYKVGSYKKEFGPLSSKTTNQTMFKIKNGKMIDITNKMIKNYE